MKKLSYREVIEAKNICYCIKRYMPTYVNSEYLNEKFYSNNKKEALIESNCRRKYSYIIEEERNDHGPLEPPETDAITIFACLFFSIWFIVVMINLTLHIYQYFFA